MLCPVGSAKEVVREPSHHLNESSLGTCRRECLCPDLELHLGTCQHVHPAPDGRWGPVLHLEGGVWSADPGKEARGRDLGLQGARVVWKRDPRARCQGP